MEPTGIQQGIIKRKRRSEITGLYFRLVKRSVEDLSRCWFVSHEPRLATFFDEAEALFGNAQTLEMHMTSTANQEVAYLLKKMEDHNGIVVPVTNMKSNIDDAFARRFNSIIHFS
jgi:SpoVK/Ycf46/Vps4 family AAA+-type ATPase